MAVDQAAVGGAASQTLKRGPRLARCTRSPRTIASSELKTTACLRCYPSPTVALSAVNAPLLRRSGLLQCHVGKPTVGFITKYARKKRSMSSKALQFPKKEELCLRTACCCFEEAFYCSGDQCCTCLAEMTFGYDCCSNIWCDMRQHFCCVDTVAVIPFIKNVSTKKIFGDTAAIALLGIVCSNCGPDYETGTQCCLCHNVKEYKAAEFGTFNDVCCANSCFCCTSGCSEKCVFGARAKARVNNCSCTSNQQFCCCIQHAACFPGQNEQWPATCSCLGVQCYPTCAWEGCGTVCCGEFPEAKPYPEPSFIDQLEDYVCINLPAISAAISDIPAIDCTSFVADDEIVAAPVGAACPLCDQGHTMEIKSEDPYKGNSKYTDGAECDVCAAKNIYSNPTGRAYRCPHCTLEGGYDMCITCGNKKVRDYIAANKK